MYSACNRRYKYLGRSNEGKYLMLDRQSTTVGFVDRSWIANKWVEIDNIKTDRSGKIALIQPIEQDDIKAMITWMEVLNNRLKKANSMLDKHDQWENSRQSTEKQNSTLQVQRINSNGNIVSRPAVMHAATAEVIARCCEVSRQDIQKQLCNVLQKVQDLYFKGLKSLDPDRVFQPFSPYFGLQTDDFQIKGDIGGDDLQDRNKDPLGWYISEHSKDLAKLTKSYKEPDKLYNVITSNDNCIFQGINLMVCARDLTSKCVYPIDGVIGRDFIIWYLQMMNRLCFMKFNLNTSRWTTEFEHIDVRAFNVQSKNIWEKGATLYEYTLCETQNAMLNIAASIQKGNRAQAIAMYKHILNVNIGYFATKAELFGQSGGLMDNYGILLLDDRYKVDKFVGYWIEEVDRMGDAVASSYLRGRAVRDTLHAYNSQHRKKLGMR